ncbi:polysaccharide deacetylase [Streptomyces cinnamoneus]|uniref:Polysaccharide deacetylase n=1 Tax=Streptomyces cinnamoneus TaxID=53446 RepID=A0A2G1XND9_STRCJ|nr:polysaccharide deacetylase [Streptomyces cinnamoneus]PHQ52691.1 polysaccharide deacetylase [Streptomyces cinnamoneus]PPT12125.1 polysaccharide deacetylase [Streptomyces cinnamoneus]
MTASEERDQATQRHPWQWEEAEWRGVVERVRAGRSLKPDVWPQGARAAVALSFDTDHETIPLRDGQTGPGKLSQGEYGARVGSPRVLALLERRSIPATFFMPAVCALMRPQEAREYSLRGHEIGIHGWIHERNMELDPKSERDLAFRCADTLERVSGQRPVGIRTPSWDFSDHTLDISRELGLLYDSSLMADDDPYEILADGEPTGIVELPPEWIRDDDIYFEMDRYSPLRPHGMPRQVVGGIWRDEFDVAYEEGGLFQLTMHPHVIGHRSRITVLEELLAHIEGHEGIWYATHAEIARYVKDQAKRSTESSS